MGALQPHQVAGVELDIHDIDALAVRDQVTPIGALRRGQRRRDDLEVDRVIGIGEDEQLIAAVGDRILHADFPRRDKACRRVGIGEIDQPLLGGFVVAAGDHAETSARTFVEMREPAGILLFIDQNIVRLRCTETMTPDLHRAMVVVEFDIEEALAVGAPHHRAVGLLDEIVTVGAIGPVAHADREIFRALNVGAPCLKPVIRRMPGAAEPEIFVVGRKLVAIEDNLGLPAVARHAAEHFVLAALAELAHIGIRTVRRGHAGIVFLDSPAHFSDQRFLQTVGMAEQAFGIGVFRLKILADIRIQNRGVAQHFLPVPVLQPRVIVDNGDAMGGECMRPARRDGRRLGNLWGDRLCHLRPRSLRIRPPSSHIGSI